MESYDYVIVGAGSAGCVLAARLTEDPDVRVLLLEAGPPDVKENVHVPLGYLQLAKTDVDWDYSTAPEPFCGGRRIYLPAGQNPRRLLLDQRDDLHPRQPPRLRRLGHRRLGLGRPAALLPARRGLLPRRVRSARHGRPADGLRLALEQQDGRGLRRRPGSRPASRPTTISTGPSRTASGSTTSPSAAACVARRRWPTCTRRWSARTSTSVPSCSSSACCSRAPGDRRGGRAARPGPRVPRRAGGAPVRRRLQLPAVAPAVGRSARPTT